MSISKMKLIKSELFVLNVYIPLFQCVRVLLKYECDASIKDNNGLTAADLAENCWHRDCAATLRRRLGKVIAPYLLYIKAHQGSFRNHCRGVEEFREYTDCVNLLRHIIHQIIMTNQPIIAQIRPFTARIRPHTARIRPYTAQ